MAGIDGIARLIDGKLCINSSALGEAFGISQRTLGNWAKHGCPKVKPGWWSIADVIVWRGLNPNASNKSGDMSDGAAKLKAEAELKQLQVDQLALKNAVTKEKYVSRNEVVTELSRYSVELKQSLLGLSKVIMLTVGSHVDQIAARTIESELSRLINQALTRMSSGQIYEPEIVEQPKAKKRKPKAKT